MQILYRNAEKIIDASAFHINHLGYGVFETFLAKFIKGNANVLRLDLHIERLRKGCEKLGIKFPGEKYYIDFISEALDNLKSKAQSPYRVRIVVYEKDWFLQMEPFLEKNKSIKLKSLQMERSLPEIKSCSALTCVYSQKIAREAGFDEALLLDKQGIIRETSWGNFFWFDAKGELYTAEDNILLGVTREILLDLAGKNIKVNAGDYSFDLERIEAAFTCRSTLGISEVSAIDERELGTGYTPIKELQVSYDSI
jgi:branched-chain amino acid aminotransferase